jgi:hypothetical protein
MSEDYLHETKHFVSTIGDACSGSSIMLAILDSHPSVRMSNEQLVYQRWMRGWSRERILEQVMTSGLGSKRSKRRLIDLPCEEWTGLQEPLLVIGDKRGIDMYKTMRRYGVGLDIIDNFSEFIGFPIKLIHTVRNPYDNISARTDKPRAVREVPDHEVRFQTSFDRFVAFYAGVDPLLSRYPHFKLYNEELIKDPRGTITKLCEYLELPVVEPWITTAAGAVFTKPHNRKDNREWLPGHKEKIEAQLIDKYSYFNRYKEGAN